MKKGSRLGSSHPPDYKYDNVRQSVSPPPYHLHELKSHTGDITFIDPWHSETKQTPVDDRIDPATYIPHSTPRYRRSIDLDGSLPLPYTPRRSTWRRLSVGFQSFVRSEPFWLALYFLFNLGLTLYNKIILVTFPFPYTLTSIHALCGSVGCYILQENGFYIPARLTARQNITLLSFSVLYTVNIAVSNLSLQLVTVPFHQVVRAASPFFTIVLAYFLTGSAISLRKLFSLIPVVAGVGFTTYGDYYFTWWGLVLTLFGTLLASLKTTVTNMLQSGTRIKRRSTVERFSSQPELLREQGLQLHPLDLLGRMCPLAFIQCILYGWISGELENVTQFGAIQMDSRRMMALWVNGVIAFGLNVVSFTANKKSGPLAISVAANVKQVLTMLLAVSIFDLIITPMNMVGIVLTLAGGAWYAVVEYQEKQKRSSLAIFTSLRPHGRTE